MLINNTIESSKRPGIPGQHRPDLKWYKDALNGKSDVGHVHTKKEIEDFEHNHDGRYYRKDLNELDVILSGNGTPNFNQGDDGDYYIDELNEDMYVKEGDAWRLLIHLKGDKGDPGIDGIDGIDGYTPVRGVDYWTEEDQNKIVSEVESTIKDKRDELDQHAEELKEEISGELTDLTDSKVKELEDATAGLIEEVTSLELQERVAELEKENQEQQEEIDALYGDLEDGEASGEVVTISDGVPKTKVEVDGDGNTVQEVIEAIEGTIVVDTNMNLTDVDTTKESKISINGGIEQDTSEQGINFLDLTKLEDIIKSNMNMTVSKTSNGISLKLLKGTSAWQSISWDITKILSNLNGKSITFTISLAENSDISDGNTGRIGGILRLLGFDKETGTESSTHKHEIPITTQGVIHNQALANIDTTLYDYKLILFPTDNTALSSDKTIIYDSIGIFSYDVINTDTSKYVDFIPNKPSLDYSSEVKGVSGHYDNVVSNKNFCSEIEVGNINASGNNFTDENSIRSKNYDLVKPNTTYIASKNGQGTGFNVNEYDSDKKHISRTYCSTGVFTTSKTTRYVRLQILGTLENTIQLEAGNTATDHTPHQEQNLPIDIPFNMYSGKPYKENGKWYRDIEWLKVVIDETLANTALTTYAGNTFYNIPNQLRSIQAGGAYCNMFKYNKANSGLNASMKQGEFAVQSIVDTTYSAFHFYTEFATVEDFKTKLKELYNNGTPLYVVYKLAEPYAEEITDTTLIEQLEALQNAEFYEGVTNINSYKSSEDVADMPLEVHYNFITPAPSIKRPGDIEAIESVNRIGKATLRSTNRGVTLINNEDGSFTLNGTSTDSIYIDFETNIKEAGTYEVAFNENKLISSFGGDVRFIFKKDDTTINDTIIINKQNYSVTLQDNNLPNKSYIWLNKGNTFDNVTFYPSVTKGIVNKPYLPYGTIGLLQRNKNVFKFGNINVQPSGITVDKISEKRIKINGTTTSEGRILFSTSDKPINKAMILSGKKISGNVDKNIALSIYEGLSSWNRISEIAHLKDIGFTKLNDIGLKSNTYQIGIFINKGVIFDNYEIEFQFEYGDTVTEIVEPKENLIPIDLQGNRLAKVGEIKDLLNIGLDGSVSIEKNIVNIITQLEAQAFNNDLGYRLYRGIAEDTQGTQVLSNKFKYNANAGNGSDFGLRINSSLKALVGLAPNLSIGDTVETEVYLQKANPDTINLPSINPIKLFEGTNVFELVTNLDTTLTVHYKVSNKKQIIENNNRLTALEATVNTLLGGN